MDIRTRITLNSGTKIPQLGFGTALIDGGEEATVAVILSAIQAGYRHLDTATIYGSEEAVGKAVRQSGIPREEFFITTKVWNTEVRSETVRQSFEESLERLQMDYVDMYMIHWPVPGKYIKAWLEIEEIVATGRAKTAGVSNFNQRQLKDLFMTSDLIPAVNQCEFHPRFANREIRVFCKAHGIAFQSYRPLGQGAYLGDEALAAIGAQHGKSFAQVILRWNIQKGVIAIPKASSPARIQSNAEIFDFELSADDMLAIDGMNRNRSTTNCTPDCFDF